MQWIKDFDLFLFDFDGLLVNTEPLHYEAYREMCRRRGANLDWHLSDYVAVAHAGSTSLSDAIYQQFPQLYQEEPLWNNLYLEKKEIYRELLKQGGVSLMAGVERVLKEISRLGKSCCVVTNSTQSQVDYVKSRIALLDTIPLWITRESYVHPKPSPDGYLKALSLLSPRLDARIAGFEDSLRGFQALQRAAIPNIFLISASDHPQLQQEPLNSTPFVSSQQRGDQRKGSQIYYHFTSFEEVNDRWQDSIHLQGREHVREQQ